jgi:hypothetical protein
VQAEGFEGELEAVQTQGELATATAALATAGGHMRTMQACVDGGEIVEAARCSAQLKGVLDEVRQRTILLTPRPVPSP